MKSAGAPGQSFISWRKSVAQCRPNPAKAGTSEPVRISTIARVLVDLPCLQTEVRHSSRDASAFSRSMYQSGPDAKASHSAGQA